MDPNMVTRLRGIANGSLSRKQRVARVTDPPPLTLQEGLHATANRKPSPVTRATRVTRAESMVALNSSNIRGCR